MPTTLGWGEQVTVLMELGFPIDYFTLDDATLGQLDGTGYLDGQTLGDDVSEYCQEIKIDRGRPDQLQNFNAGTATIQLKNTDRRFDPINQSSPYWNSTLGMSGITPRRKVTIYSGATPLFTGRITDIDIGYAPTRSGVGYDLSFATITASDDFVLLANTYTQSDIAPTEQYSGARVSAILDLPEVAYSATTRTISTGTAVVGGGAPYTIAANTNVLTYLQDVATAEQGYFFIGANGYLTFTNRIAAAFITTSATFSDAGSNIPYSGLDVVYGQEFLYNKIISQTITGTPQVANDATSQSQYGISTLSLDDLLLSSDAAALQLSQDLLFRYKQPAYRFDRLQVDVNALSVANRNTVIGLEMANYIQVTRSYNVGSPASVTLKYAIESITHTITGSTHKIEFGLADVQELFAFILDDATYGVLDNFNALT